MQVVAGRKQTSLIFHDISELLAGRMWLEMIMAVL